MDGCGLPFLRSHCGLHPAQSAAGSAAEQCSCGLTYGTNSEFGFDYLRDNGMANNRDDQVQREHYFAIVDEVDSILIDEARTPLIISGPAVVIPITTSIRSNQPFSLWCSDMKLSRSSFSTGPRGGQGTST